MMTMLPASMSRRGTRAGLMDQNGPRVRVRKCASFLIYAQRFEAGDDVEQFLVDSALAQPMECPVEILQQFVDVFVGALHRGQSARVLAREGFGARPEQRDEKIFADERPQGRGGATYNLGQASRWPGKFGQLASPVFVQR